MTDRPMLGVFQKDDAQKKPQIDGWKPTVTSSEPYLRGERITTDSRSAGEDSVKR
ncbi:hypothetical protein RKD19_002988 [Streptomyces canus]|uniref:hypothetical protein n=1 Tax=unclassified Streptomyces TaxID=2593676 RepID=UPI0037A0D645